MTVDVKAVDRDALARARRVDPALLVGIESEIDACHRLSCWRRILEVLPFIGMYLAGAWLASAGSWKWWLGVLAMGVAMNTLGILIHEGLHGLLARSRVVNHFWSFLCGVPLLVSASAYRKTHADHHIEFGRALDYGTYRQHLGKPVLVWAAYLLQLVFGSVIYILLIPVLGMRGAGWRVRLMIVLELSLIAVFVVMLVRMASWESVCTYWLWPAVVMMALTNVRGLASHALGDVEDIYLSSRTVSSSPWVRFLFLHENHHLEHHLFPQVPSYHLARAHRLVWNRLPKALHASSYTGFLCGFFRALVGLSLNPLGVVHPVHESVPDFPPRP